MIANTKALSSFGVSIFGSPVRKRGLASRGMRSTLARLACAVVLLAIVPTVGAQSVTEEVGLYKTFERSIENTKTYANRFADVTVTAAYVSPSGKKTTFQGFFDGDGNGGGSKGAGAIWKIRFLPNELGAWTYSWTWSDGTAGGSGTFQCVSAGAGKGILKPYAKNPRWFAYNGTDPVYLKSYYESGHGSVAQPLDWLVKNVYQPILDRGYNHLQVNWLLPLCCEEQFYNDGPAKTISNVVLYEAGKASSTMRLDVWRLLEGNVRWFNDRNVGLHMFLGFNGGRNSGPDWKKLSSAEQDFYVRYVLARLAPYANIAGWNYTWEVSGSDAAGELGLARLIQKYDVFDHLRTYEDEAPKSNEYARPEYNFAAIENHYIHSSDKTVDRPMWKEAWTHHQASLLGYVPGKPTYMSEGNALWRRYWHAKIGADLDDLRRAAWGVATAAGSFNWNGHKGENSLVASGNEGLPFGSNSHPFASSAKEIDILGDVMQKKVVFHSMVPGDAHLSGHDAKAVWCLAEPGKQYLVFSSEGKPFSLKLGAGSYASNHWINTKTGAEVVVAPFHVGKDSVRSFAPPDTKTDWALAIRQSAVGPVSVSGRALGASVRVWMKGGVVHASGLQDGATLLVRDVSGKRLAELGARGGAIPGHPSGLLVVEARDPSGSTTGQLLWGGR
jgi:hypothetical protein